MLVTASFSRDTVSWDPLRSWDRTSLTNEEFRARVTDFMSVYAKVIRDYQIRVISDDDYTLQLLPATCGHLVNDPSNIEIPFHIPWQRPLGEIRHMIKVGINRVAGKLTLLVNAKEFHEQLDELGCTHSNGKYVDRPPSSCVVANTTHQMSTEMLLLRDYKEVEIIERVKEGDVYKNVPKKVFVTATADLSAVWSNPPSFENCKKLCNSAEAAARKILEHYQPIDIAIEIHKKVVQ